MKKIPKFDPSKDFGSPAEAVEYCRQFQHPVECAKEIVLANIDMGEFGFASELVTEMQELDDDACMEQAGN